MKTNLIKTIGYIFLAQTLFLPHSYAKDISSERAHRMAQFAALHCSGLGYKVSATVVDSAGYSMAVFRMDGAGPHTLDASRRKAYTAASAKNKTSAMLIASQTNPEAQNLGQIDGFLLLGGGIPLTMAGIPIGGIGVGGAPSGTIDEICAQAGIDSELKK
ncbi:heme-binding protein [Bacteriovorax sp. PP10]|uniref:Heme-binding protein n=1 Tax=Bacteriovorax antarcticus TaxID=3088717 RepID=A0ABU5VYU5_9BACT|nr:heme-binding protein [Bacteriovorax sp. PP10]MEA9358171.1 heme-binding protein [Bacteriovorax sp. PP10]